MQPKRAALYARVSTADQVCENQLLDLKRYCNERGWLIADQFVDRGVSGTVSSRPALDRLMDGVRKKKYDTVLVWRFDRFARSVKHLVLALSEMKELGVDFVSYQENIDTGSSLGQAIFTIIAAMAELEKNIIIERVRAGLRRARQEGKRIGRPLTGEASVEKMLALQSSGLRQYQIAAELGVSRAYVSRSLHKPLLKAVV